MTKVEPGKPKWKCVINGAHVTLAVWLFYLRASKAFISCISPSPPPPLPPLDRLESLLPPDPGGLLSSWGTGHNVRDSGSASDCLLLSRQRHPVLTLWTFRSLAPASAAARPEGWCWTPGGPPGGPPPVGSGGGMGGGTAMGGGGPGGGGGAGGPAMGAGIAAAGGATESMAGWPAETGGPGRGRVRAGLMADLACLAPWKAVWRPPEEWYALSLYYKHTTTAIYVTSGPWACAANWKWFTH